MITTSSGSLSSLPNGRIIDFRSAEIRTVAFQDSLYLWVTGAHPGADLEVRLAPRYYNERPDYWAVEVAAIRRTGPAEEPIGGNTETYERSIPLVGVTGLRGITVIGANRMLRIELHDNVATL